jgi:hypothetical protein
LWNLSRVSESVGEPKLFTQEAELLLKESLSIKKLTHEGFSAAKNIKITIAYIE